jgi:membrane protease YdiL (CAAX protease family)
VRYAILFIINMVNYIKNSDNLAKKYLILCFLLIWIPAFFNGFYFPIVKENYIVFWILELIQWLILPIIAVYISIYKFKIISYEHLGFHNLIFYRRKTEYVVYASIIVSIILFLTYFETYYQSVFLFPTNYLQAFTYQSMIPEEPVLIVIFIVFYMALSAGFIEEAAYRGILRLVFQNNFEFNVKYVIVSSILFMVVHWEGGLRNLFSSFIFGLVCAILYLKLKNIWPLVIGHSIVDIYAFYPY